MFEVSYKGITDIIIYVCVFRILLWFLVVIFVFRRTLRFSEYNVVLMDLRCADGVAL